MLGRLEHDRVAAGERGAELPREHEQREIPGDDLSNNAHRLAERVRQEVAANGNGLTFNLVGPAGVVAEGVDDAAEVADRVGDDLAAVQRFERGELFGIFLDEVGQREHEVAAIGGVHRGPGTGFERPTRGGDGFINVGGCAGGNLGNHVAGRGVIRFELASLGGINPAAVDQQLRLMNGGTSGGFQESLSHERFSLEKQANNNAQRRYTPSSPRFWGESHRDGGEGDCQAFRACRRLQSSASSTPERIAYFLASISASHSCASSLCTGCDLNDLSTSFSSGRARFPLA